jgi:hypothetical protein
MSNPIPDETTFTKKDVEQGPASGDSSLAGISIRAWIAIILVLEVCFMSSFGKTIEEPLYSLAVMAVGFYFGQVNKKPTAQ